MRSKKVTKTCMTKTAVWIINKEPRYINKYNYKYNYINIYQERERERASVRVR